jgi:hypothetical protein
MFVADVKNIIALSHFVLLSVLKHSSMLEPDATGEDEK